MARVTYPARKSPNSSGSSLTPWDVTNCPNLTPKLGRPGDGSNQPFETGIDTALEHTASEQEDPPPPTHRPRLMGSPGG
jgi:hypothetical protein